MVGDAVVVATNANLAKCTLQHVLAVGMRHKCLFSHEKTDPYIAAIATNRKVQVTIVAVGLAGNRDEPDQIEPRGFV